FVPDLTVDNASYEQGMIKGHTEKTVENEPVTVVRLRNGETTIISTPSADEHQQYTTSKNGEYNIDDLNTKEGVIIQDDQKNTVVIINEKTGRPFIQDSSYNTIVEPGTENQHTLIRIIKDNVVSSTISLITDPNKNIENFESIPTENVTAISLVDTNKEDFIIASSLPESAPSFPGGSAIYDTEKNILLSLIGTNGDIRLLETS
ncbi:MAG: hypothetical protein GY756_27485, partial [bacterium]|nr:hypothetical protein [bacterium]